MKPSKQDAGREFADIWAEVVSSNRNLRLITGGLVFSLILMLVLTIRLAWQPHPKPIVVRVDEIGRAEAMTYEAATAQADPLGPHHQVFLKPIYP